jgi:hypothetical protein
MSYNWNRIFKSEPNEHKDKSIILQCGCHNIGHLLKIGKFEDEEDYYVTVTLDHFLPWYKRLVLGIRYILGRKPDNIMFVEIWMNRHQMDEIFKFAEETK